MAARSGLDNERYWNNNRSVKYDAGHMAPASTDESARARAAARMTREQSRAQTRERLLEAARADFARSGFHGASDDEIASVGSEPRSGVGAVAPAMHLLRTRLG